MYIYHLLFNVSINNRLKRDPLQQLPQRSAASVHPSINTRRPPPIPRMTHRRRAPRHRRKSTPVYLNKSLGHQHIDPNHPSTSSSNDASSSSDGESYDTWSKHQHMVRLRLAHFFPFMHINFCQLLRNLENEATYLRDTWQRLHQTYAQHAYETCVSLGGVYYKIGQWVSLRVDLVPAPYHRTLSTLTEKVRDPSMVLPISIHAPCMYHVWLHVTGPQRAILFRHS